MTSSRVLFVLSCLSLSAVLPSCGGGGATCDDCRGEPLSGLTVIVPDKVGVGSCAPAQIVQLDGGVVSRPSSEVRLMLEGDTGWYADAGCMVQATRATAAAGARGAIAYVKADSSGTKHARARVSGPLGGETSFEAAALVPAATTVKIGGTRYTDTTSCVPLWVVAADAAGAPASLASEVAVNLAAAGTVFFTDSSCVTATTTASIGPGHESAIVFAQFGLPGDITLSAGAASLGVGSWSVDVAGDPQLRVAFTPTGESIALTAGVCTPIGVGIVDLAGAPLAVDAMEVTVAANGARVYSDASCATETSVTTVRGGTAATVYVRATRAGNATLEASLADLQSRTVSLVVSAGPAVALSFVGSTRMTLGGCYRYLVQRVDAFDNLATGPAGAVALTSAALGIFSDAACGTTISGVNLAAGAGVAVIYVRGASLTAGATLAATLTGLTNATATIDVVGAPSAVAVTLQASATAGSCSAARVSTVDGGGAPTDTLTADSIALASSPANVVFFSDASCATPVSSVVINALANTTQVWVRGTAAAAYSLSFASSTLPSTSKPFTILPGALATIRVAGSARMNLGDCSQLDLTLSDAFGNVTTSAASLTVELPTPSRGTLHESDACTTTVSGVTFSVGSSLRQVFYKGTSLGADVVSAIGSGLSDGSLELDVVFFMGDAHATLGGVAFTRSVAIDPADSSVIYLQSLDGMVWRSGDVGLTWSKRCHTPMPDIDNGAGFIISPAADGTAYVSTGHASQLYRVDDLSGDACTSIVSGLGTVYAYQVVVGASVDSSGRLFAWNGSSGDTNLHVSDDYGATWTELYDDQTSTAYMGFMANHPTNPQIKIVDRAFAGSNPGLYRTTNGGSAWTFVTAEGFNDSTNVIKFDPAHPGYVYKTGRVSSTDGASWTADAAYAGLSLSWALDGAGAMYKFDTAVTTSTVLQRAPDARTPVWAALESTIAVPFVNSSARMSVAADGLAIAVLSGRDVYLTTDDGGEFARVPTPGDLEGASLSYAAASLADGYAVGNNVWVAAATHDGGETWAAGGAGTGTAAPMIHVNPVFPDSVYVRGEDFNSTYDRHVLSSQDGFVTVRDSNNAAAYSWAGVGGVSLADPLTFMTLGYSNCHRTVDGGVSYQQRSCPGAPLIWYPSPIGWVSPADNDVMWYAGNSGGAQGLFQASWTDGSIADISSRTGVAPAGVEMYVDGGNVMRVVSTTGQLVTSSDLAVSFGAPTPASTDGTCRARYLTSVPGQPALVAHACINGNSIAVSRNAGASWNVVPAGCQVRQIALFEAAMVVSCNEQAARTFTY